MKCKYCNHEIDESTSFCPSCGKKVNKTIEPKIRYCSKCGNPFQGDDMFCRKCGNKRSEIQLASNSQTENLQEEATEIIEENTILEEPEIVESTDIKVEDVFSEEAETNTELWSEPEPVIYETNTNNNIVQNKKNYFKNPILWIISIALLLVSILLGAYIKQNYVGSRTNSEQRESSKSKRKKENEDISNIDIEKLGITKDTTNFMKQNNTNTGGYIYYYKDILYVATSDGVISYDKDFKKKDTILEDNVSYIHVDDNYMYYANNITNDDNTMSSYYRMNLKTKEKEKILDDIYYPNHVDGILYYQHDKDNESIHMYNLETKEDKKLNDTNSYQMYVDKEKNSIYYLTYIDKVTTICRMDLDGQNNESIVSKVKNTFTYDGTALCYELDGILYKYDVTSKESSELVPSSIYDIFYSGNTIVYWDVYKGMSKLGEGNKEEKILDENVLYAQVVGEYVLCWIKNNGMCSIYVLDLDGNCAYLTDDYEIDNDYNFDDFDYDDYEDYDFDDYDTYRDDDLFDF